MNTDKNTKNNLYEWTEAKSFFRKVRQCTDSTENSDLFNNPKYQPCFDAYQGGLFASILADHFRTIEIKLVSDDFPDFQLRHEVPNFPLTLENGKLDFETTEADTKNRRRGDEYKIKNKENSNFIRKTHLPTKKELAKSAISRAIENKANKNYDRELKVNLLIDVNFSLIRDFPNPQELAALRKPSWDNFNSIWLRWNAEALCIFPEFFRYSALNDPFEK